MKEGKERLIREILDTEYRMFDRVKNTGGRASCQDNRPMFDAMRASQFLTWDEETLRSYQRDLARAQESGRNLLTEKYAYMMEETDPAAYEEIRTLLPECSREKEALIREIMELYMEQTAAFMERYPAFRAASRPVRGEDAPETAGVPDTSIETYLRGELKTYSEETLSLLLAWIRRQWEQGISMVYENYRHTSRAYGYDSVEEAAARRGK